MDNRVSAWAILNNIDKYDTGLRQAAIKQAALIP